MAGLGEFEDANDAEDAGSMVGLLVWCVDVRALVGTLALTSSRSRLEPTSSRSRMAMTTGRSIAGGANLAEMTAHQEHLEQELAELDNIIGAKVRTQASNEKSLAVRPFAQFPDYMVPQ